LILIVVSFHLSLQTNPRFFITSYLSFEDIDQIKLDILKPEVEKFLMQSFNDDTVLILNDLPEIVFRDVSFYNCSINWNKTRAEPTPISPKMLNFSFYIDNFQCNFTYEYSIKKGYGSAMIEGIYLNVLVSFNILPDDSNGLGFNISIPNSSSPIMSYTNLAVNFENDEEFTDTLNFLITLQIGSENFIQNVIRGVIVLFPQFFNNFVATGGKWVLHEILPNENMRVNSTVQVVNISIVEFEDNGLMISYLNTNLIMTMATDTSVNVTMSSS